MITYAIKQGSEDWHRLRLNRITSSRVADIFKSDNLSLVDEMIAERIVQDIPDPDDMYVNEAMQRGLDLEPDAVEAYTSRTGIIIDRSIGFCINEQFQFLGWSPDGITPDRKGAIEIKCPNTNTHVSYCRTNAVPAKYKYQVAMPFLITPDIEWVDFISYDPRFSARQLNIVRTMRADVDIDGIMANIHKFMDKLEKYYNQVTF